MNRSTLICKEAGKRLDRWLAHQFPDHSRSYFQGLIDQSHILLNGKPTKKQQRLVKGDTIDIAFEPPPQIDLHPEPIPLDILYEDDHLLAVNKSAGMVVHPAPGSYTGTFAAALLHHCQALDPNEYDPLRPGIVHRLDKDTTGVLVAAKTQKAHQQLSNQFSERQAKKNYIAICVNTPPEGKLSAPIKRHPIDRKRMIVHEEGKEAISIFSVREKKGELSVVDVELLTGRTHQIRVHLKHLGAHVLGDPAYGNPTQNKKHRIDRQLLHAHRLLITHPFSGKSLEFNAPIPSDMKKFIDQIEHP